MGTHRLLCQRKFLKNHFLKVLLIPFDLSYAWQLVNKCWIISTFLCMMGGLLTCYCASNLFLMKHFLKVELILFYLSDKSWLGIECWKISTIQWKISGALMGYCANKFFLKGIFWKYSWYSFIWASHCALAGHCALKNFNIFSKNWKTLTKLCSSKNLWCNHTNCPK